MGTVAVVGATGGVGREVVTQLLKARHEVKALARRPTRVPKRPGLRVIGGDVRDRTALDELVLDTDIALSCLGNDRLGPMVTASGTASLLDAMDAHNVQRLAVVSSIGVGDSREQGKRVSRLFMYLVVPTVLRRPFDDLHEMERIVRTRRPHDSIVVRPVGLTNKAGDGQYRAGGTDLRLGPTIPRADVAHFMVSLVDSHQYDGRAVSLGPAP